MMTPAEVETCLEYLMTSAEVYAKSYTHLQYLKKKEKIILSEGFRASKGKTKDDKNADAHITLEYKDWITEYEEAEYTTKIIYIERMRIQLKIDCWRTEASALKAGVSLI